MAVKRGYACSFATHGEIGNPNPEQVIQDKARTRATKQAICEHYNSEYNAQPEKTASELPNFSPPKLVGTKLPKDYWYHTFDKSMLSFYAGKVCPFGKRG
jgi:hypothetical protein